VHVVVHDVLQAVHGRYNAGSGDGPRVLDHPRRKLPKLFAL